MKLEFNVPSTVRIALATRPGKWAVHTVDETAARESLRTFFLTAPAGQYDLLIASDGVQWKAPRWISMTDRGYLLNRDLGYKGVDNGFRDDDGYFYRGTIIVKPELTLVPKP